MDLRCSIRGLRTDSSNKTAVVLNFALYPRFVGVINSIRLMIWLTEKHQRNSISVLVELLCTLTHVFSLLAHREFRYMPSTPRSSERPIFPMRWTFLP